MNPGDILIPLSALVAVVAGALYSRPASGRTPSAADVMFAAHAALLVLAFALLAQYFLAHRFEYTYVAQYSSRALSPALTLAALWAGQEGSFLLWAMLGALVGVALMLQPGRLTRTAMVLVCVAQLGLVLLLLARSPFARSAMPPVDGQGLNPLLEDPWMVAHPPVLFVGYAAMLVPAALAAAALLRNDAREWNRMVWPWALFAVVSLGTGIVLGGIWAYKTLGWGGYWGWDPVENASLVPWLIAVALLHGLLIQRTLGALVRTNLLLALLGWTATVGGTYLTRSGVLSDFSVHSFADSGLNAPLLLFLGGTAALSVGLLAWRWRGLARTTADWIGVSRESALWLGLMTVLAFATLVAVGTTAPILTALAGKPANVQPTYYQGIAVPIGLLLLILMALAPALRWVRQQGTSWLALLPPGIVTGGLTLAVTLPMGLRDPVFVALAFLTGCALGINAWVAARLFRRGWTFGAGYLGHVGVAVMALGIAVSTSVGQTQRLTLPEGKPMQALGLRVTYSGHETDARGARYLKLRVEGRGLAFDARPRLMPSPRGDGMIRTPAIHGWRELYLSPVDVKSSTLAHAHAVWLERGQTITAGGVGYTFQGFRMQNAEQHLSVRADIEVRRGNVAVVASPAVNATPQGMESVPVEVAGLGMLSIAHVDADHGRVALQMPGAAPASIAIVDVSTKPLVNLVWVGAVVMLLGSSLAGLRRAGEQASRPNAPRPAPVAPQA
jgi:cytochrome c-type biogenesis protein CcmF